MHRTINGASLRKMFVGGVALLDQNKKLVDALNVFPVPDGDTGTNMFLTLKSAIAEVNNCIGNEISDLCEAFSKGALRGARGNSGVITSQIVKGLCSVLAESKEISSKTFAKAIVEGCRIAYIPVIHPRTRPQNTQHITHGCLPFHRPKRAPKKTLLSKCCYHRTSYLSPLL